MYAELMLSKKHFFSLVFWRLRGAVVAFELESGAPRAFRQCFGFASVAGYSSHSMMSVISVPAQRVYKGFGLAGWVSSPLTSHLNFTRAF